MATTYCYTMDSPKSAFEHSESIENIKNLMIEEMRRGAAESHLDLATECSLIWFPPQFLVLLWSEDENGEEIVHRVVAQTAEEATHIRLMCEAVYNPVGL